MRAHLLIAAAAALLPALALAHDDVPTTRTLAGGRAAATADDDNGSLTVNPATLALAGRYDLTGTFRLGQDLDYAWGVSVVDAKTSKIALGLAFHRDISDPEPTSADLPGWVTAGEDFTNRKRYYNLDLGVAYPFWDRRFTLGIGGTLQWADHDQGGKGFTGNADVGLTAIPTEGLTLAVAGNNLIPLHSQPDMPATVVFGARYRVPDLGFLQLDVQGQLEGLDGAVPISVRTGLSRTAERVDVQIGYRYEGPAAQHWLSTGFNVLGGEEANASIGYGVAVPLRGKLRLGSLVHVFGLGIRG